jgi:hypothetical protein
MLVAAMTDLLLQPTGDPDDYEVVADLQIVGRELRKADRCAATGAA